MRVQNKQQGFSLLESLLALFILSIGLLGVAAMHGQALKTGFVASQNMSIVLKGEELFERMRANPQGIEDYAGSASSHGCTSGSRCDPAEMAADDLFIFDADVNDILSSPTISISVNDMAVALEAGEVVKEVTIDIGWTTKNISYNYITVAEIGQ